MEYLVRDLRFALHSTQLSHHSVYQAVEQVLKSEVPEHFGGRTDI
ncbi:hypothetical protein [Streptomyces sp. NPDC059278]